MVNFFAIFLVVLFVTAFGSSIGYLLWLKTRPKKETYHARIYQLGEGVIETLKTKEGQIDLSKLHLCLRELQPFSKDIVEKIDTKEGLTVYRLQKLNKAIDGIEGGIETWEAGKKEITVLKIGESYTQIKKAYNEKIGEEIFHPLPHSRINMIKNEMAIREARLHDHKDIIQAITPWVVAGICMVGLACISYIFMSGMVKVSEHNRDMSNVLSAKEDKLLNLDEKIDTLLTAYGTKKQSQPQQLGEQSHNKTFIIPMVE